MLAVLEKTLSPFVSVDFPLGNSQLPQQQAPVDSVHGALGHFDWVPSAPVQLSIGKRLPQPQALQMAQDCVAGALEDLRQSELALERQLESLRTFMNRKTATI